MERFEKHIFVCLNEREAGHPKGCCKSKGGEDVFRAFRKQLADLGLKERFKVSKAGCLASCENGVTIVVYPEGIWYRGVVVENVEQIIDDHFLRNTPIEALRLFPKHAEDIENDRVAVDAGVA